MVDCQPNVINPLLHCSIIQTVHVYMHQLKCSEHQTLLFIKFAMLGKCWRILFTHRKIVHHSRMKKMAIY